MVKVHREMKRERAKASERKYSTEAVRSDDAIAMALQKSVLNERDAGSAARE